MDWLDVLNFAKDLILGLPGNVMGEISGDLVEGALLWVSGKCKENKFTKRVGEAVMKFAEKPEGARMLEAVSKNVPKPPKKRLFRHGDKARDIAKQAIDGIDGFSVEKWAKALLKNIDLTEYNEQTARDFVAMLSEIQSAAVEYWKSFLDSENFAVVNLVARTVETETSKLKEELLGELRTYLFTPSGAPMSAGEGPKVKILTCENCGETIDPKSLRPTETAGIYGCICPTCGRALSFGDFTKAGKEWSEECETKLDAVLDGIRSCNRNINKILEEIEADHRRLLKQIEARRQKLFEDTHAGNINESVVVDDAKRLLELVPDDILAQFYVFVAENNSEAIEYFLGRIDVVACGAEVVCAMLDYLVEPLEPRMKGALLSLNDRALTQNVFNRGQHTKYMTAIQQGSFFDPLARYHLFIAYKSSDRAEVDALLRELEKQQLTCFVAYRDLPHGRGAGGSNYWTRLKIAMDHSSGIVFVSTPNSRSMECDAIRREDETVDGGEGELDYFKQFSPKEKVRIEYRPPSDRETETPHTIAKFLKRFFGDVEYCKSPEEVADCANRFLHPVIYADPKGDESDLTFEGTTMSETKAQKTGRTHLWSTRRKEAKRSRKLPSEVKEEEKKLASIRATPSTSFTVWFNKELREFHGTEAEIVIPGNVIDIKDGAFFRRRGLARIRFKKKVSTIGDDAFKGCCELRSAILPDSVTKIGMGAFEDCLGLTILKIGRGVGLMGRRAFKGCSGLEVIYVDPRNVTYHSTNNCLIETTTHILVAAPKNCMIPDDGSVTKIGESAFERHSELTSIVIPAGVTEIGKNAFKGCNALMGIAIPDGVTLIGESAFEGCNGLMSLSIPESVTAIGVDAFKGCSKIRAVKMPTGRIWSVPRYALEKVILTGGGAIMESAFEGCSRLKCITIPASVTAIGNHAFRGCSALERIIYQGTRAQWEQIAKNLKTGAVVECTQDR